MVPVNQFLPGFFWKDVLGGRQAAPLLSRHFDPDLWLYKFMDHLVVYDDYVNRLSHRGMPKPRTPFSAAVGPGNPPVIMKKDELILNPPDDDWLDREFLSVLFARLAKGPGKENIAAGVTFPICDDYFVNHEVELHALLIFYIAIQGGKTDISLEVALRIDAWASRAWYRSGCAAAGIELECRPKFHRLQRSAAALGGKVAERMQPVIQAYESLPARIKAANPHRIAVEVRRKLESERIKPPSLDSIKRYLRRSGIMQT